MRGGRKVDLILQLARFGISIHPFIKRMHRRVGVNRAVGWGWGCWR